LLTFLYDKTKEQQKGKHTVHKSHTIDTPLSLQDSNIRHHSDHDRRKSTPAKLPASLPNNATTDTSWLAPYGGISADEIRIQDRMKHLERVPHFEEQLMNSYYQQQQQQNLPLQSGTRYYPSGQPSSYPQQHYPPTGYHHTNESMSRKSMHNASLLRTTGVSPNHSPKQQLHMYPAQINIPPGRPTSASNQNNKLNRGWAGDQPPNLTNVTHGQLTVKATHSPRTSPRSSPNPYQHNPHMEHYSLSHSSAQSNASSASSSGSPRKHTHSHTIGGSSTNRGTSESYVTRK